MNAFLYDADDDEWFELVTVSSYGFEAYKLNDDGERYAEIYPIYFDYNVKLILENVRVLIRI